MTRTSHPWVQTSGEAVAAAARLTDRLLRETRDELFRVHVRAAQWLACLAAGAVAIPALWASRGATPWAAGAPASMLATVGCLAAIVAAAALVLALVRRAGGSADVTHVPEMVAELCRLKRLAGLKDRYVRAGMVLATLSGALLIASAL